MVKLRPPLSPPTSRGGTIRYRLVEFRHPAYPDTFQPLLRLGAIDNDRNEKPGVDYDVAFLACCIITGNTWHTGWLACKDAAGSLQEMHRPDDGILTGGTYYFCLDRQNPSRMYASYLFYF